MSGFGTNRFPPAKPGDGWRYEITQKVAEPGAADRGHGAIRHRHAPDLAHLGLVQHRLGRAARGGVAQPPRQRTHRRMGGEVPRALRRQLHLAAAGYDADEKELDYAVNTLELRVASVSSNCRGDYLGEARFRPFWEAVHAHDLAVFIHPHGSTDMRLQKYFLWNGIGQPIEETTRDDFPDLRGHARTLSPASRS